MNAATDRLYELLPAVYRLRDAEQGYALRDLLRVACEQADIVQADIESLYDSWFIETCDDWLVPYIGDLVGWSPVHEAGQPGDPRVAREAARNRILLPRRDVAHTVRARRRKGTLALLELLARDVAAWPARVVESYRLLSWTQHANHPWPSRARTLDLRHGDVLDRLDGPFDTSAHRPDVRASNSARTRGFFGVPELVLWAFRLRAFSVSRTPAYCRDKIGRNCYTFSVLGNNSPLFVEPTPEPTLDAIAAETNVPTPIRRRALHERRGDYYGAGRSLRIFRDTPETEIPAEQLVVADLSAWTEPTQPGQVAIDPALGRIVFRDDETPRRGVWVDYRYGFSAAMGGGEYERTLSQPAGARLYRVGHGAQHARLNDALAAWAAEAPRDAVIEIVDSDVYVEELRVVVPPGASLQVRAANRARPVLRLLDWQTSLADSLALEIGAGARVTLDGLLVTGRAVSVRPGATGEVPAGCDAARLVIRHCTLVPGLALGLDCACEHPSEASLEIEGLCGRVTIEHSIVGALRISADEVTSEPLRLEVADSVIDATSEERDAIARFEARLAHVTLDVRRSTIFGAVHVHALELGEDTLFQGLLRVARRQVGCLRYSSVLKVDGLRTPRRHACQPDLAEQAAVTALAVERNAGDPALAAAEEQAARAAARERVRPRFASCRYGTPDYARLHDDNAPEILRGAHDESELGAFHDLYEPQRAANLRARLDEYTPAGHRVGVRFAT
jgi:hypothetical protein